MKYYPLEICTLHDLDSGETLVYYSKGHHPVYDFIGEALKEHDVIIKVTDVRISYMRWEFASGSEGVPSRCGKEHNHSGRGMFPVTLCDKWEDD